MIIQTVRGHLLLGAALLSLAACSSPEPAPTAPATVESEAAAPDASASPDAAPAPAAEASASPSAPASPSSSPSPSASPVAKPVAAAAAKPVAPAAAPAPVAVVTPPPTWARCAVCHSSEKGAPAKIGPNLFGVYGHKMGQGSYAFSDAVKGAGLALDDATLDKWLENPRALVPGNMMSFPGLKDPAKRAEIITYLKQLH
ncbi:MAG: hypothetical protein RIS94_1645 [Pseudomonadota bacterium]